MWRRRWRCATIVAFLILVIEETQCQGDNDFYYTPERSFAQVQPPIFQNSRPSNYYDNGENYRIGQNVQPLPYNDGRIRYPSPNYDQNPSPFQLPTGRSQSSAQYYINQPELATSQRQRFRPALPYNFQLVHPHPASTKRPDTSQIHSVAYQNDPSKPETFLGQITINNPDIDYLQNSRFKNIPFDGNSLKSNGQSGHIAHDDELDNDHDLFDHHKVTTYNPTKIAGRQKINMKPNSARFTHFETLPTSEVKKPKNMQDIRNVNNNLKSVQSIPKLYQGSSTEYKSLLDLEPLLEDDISDISSFRKLIKNTEGSFDVQVIKSNYSKDSDDSKPDASSMNTENMPNNLAPKIMSVESSTSQSHRFESKNITVTKMHDHDTNDENINDEEEGEVGEEYVEYYEDAEDSSAKHTTTKLPSTTNSEPVTDIYDEYDSSDEPEKPVEGTKVNMSNSFDVLVMKPNKTMVKDDNFQQFVDTSVIDQTDLDSDNDTTSPSQKFTFSNEDVSFIETPSILGQEVVSVVTTKSVVNGTISIPDVTYPPTPRTKTVTPAFKTENNDSFPVTTESWIVVASVQTSRSVSGARFLPFPTVEQDEKKQVLAEEDEEIVTENPKQDISGSGGSSSTENINDKLDSIQSELSSAVLSGNLNNDNKNIELITEKPSEPNISTTTATPSVINVFTLKSTQYAAVTEKSFPEPLPVQIKKFTPRLTTTTTPKPKKKLVTIMDDLSGLLPAGYKSRQSYKNKRTSTTSTTTSTTTPTTTTTSTTTTLPPQRSSTDHVIINGTQGRSSGISSKNKVIILDDKSLLPKEYKPKERNPEILFKQNQEDINKFLPSGYKSEPNKTSKANKTINLDNFKNIKELDVSSFLPKGFQFNTSSTTTTTEKNKVFSKIHSLDITAFLPPGFKVNSSESEKDDNLSIKFKDDIGNFLPPENKTDNPEENRASTTSSPGGFKLVFPSRPGGKTTRKTTTQKSSIGPPLVTPKIHKGWQTRATTEFTGWPSPSTTPFSLEKLLELQRNATSTTPMIEVSTESTTRRIIITSTTTSAPPQPTTPGVCRHDCDIAGTIKIVSGVTWIPELLDQHTKEWQQLAKEVKQELNSVYSKSDLLNKWYKGIRIDGFSQGSVLVDYFIELNNVEESVDTHRLKKIFHKSLHEAKAGSVVEEEMDNTFDPDVMVGDQPDEERMRKSDEKMTKTIDKSAGKLEMGKFVMDPAYTEFIVLPKREEPTFVQSDEESLLPQWGIAVIVIALASLLFVVIFGVTVLVNRQKSTKTKQPIPLSEDMLRELDKSHMGGFDDNIHQLKERDMPYLPPGKRMSSAFIEQLAYPNPGDSWRSEWTPQLQKYMQHYAPDSGRGSQIYGTTGNGYGGGGSQLYGHTGTGAGSQGYGYTGEFPRSHYSRRRSEYDSNF